MLQGFIGGRAPTPLAAGGLGLQTGLVAFWDFANTSWLDSTGNGNTLTGHNAPTTTTGPGSNSAVSLSTSAFLSHADTAALSFNAKDFSINLWVNIPSNSDSGLFGKGVGFANRDISWDVASFAGNSFNSPNVWSNSGQTSNAAGGSNTIPSSTWSMLTTTYKNSTNTIKTYINMVQDGSDKVITVSPGVIDTADDLTIGMTETNPTGIAKSMALVGIWNSVVLSTGQITSLYNTGSGLSYAAMA